MYCITSEEEIAKFLLKNKATKCGAWYWIFGEVGRWIDSDCASKKRNIIVSPHAIYKISGDKTQHNLAREMLSASLGMGAHII